MVRENIQYLESKLRGLIPILPIQVFQIPDFPIPDPSPQALFILLGNAPEEPYSLRLTENNKFFFSFPSNPNI